MTESKLKVQGVDLSRIRNRNEKLVAKYMPEVLEQDFSDFLFESLDIEDIYALALNLLPAKYTQRGTIVLDYTPSEYKIREAIREATQRVLDNPTRAEK